MGMTLAPMIEGMEQRMRNEMVGNGRGLNPFGHIQGRVPLFPPSPAISDSHDHALKNDANERLSPSVSSEIQRAAPQRPPKDVSLLKLALDGIPAAIMSPELKLKVADLQIDVIKELLTLMNSQLKDKSAVLLTFSTILCYYWEIPEFRAEVDAHGTELMRNLFRFSLASESGHVVSAALNLALSISRSPSSLSDSLLEETIVLLVDRTIEEFKTKSKATQLCLKYLENADPVGESAKVYVQIFERAVFHASSIASLSQDDMAEQVLRSIDLAAMKLTGNSVDPFASGKLDVSRVITLAERSHQQLQLPVPHIIRLALEH
jgi:hypothetical protein